MTSANQFPSRLNWRWIKISAIFMALGLAFSTFVGPLSACGLFTAGLLVSFVGFFRSSGWPTVVLALFHGLFMAVMLVLNAAFGVSDSPIPVPALTQKAVHSAGLVVYFPEGWSAQSVPEEKDPTVVLKYAFNQFLTLQEIRVQMKKVSIKKNELAEPDLKLFTVKKLWLRFHHVSVIGYKAPNLLCSVSVPVLPPHVKLAEDLCKAVFKKMEVPVTIGE